MRVADFAIGLLLAVVAGAEFSSAQQPAARPDPLVRENATEQLSPHVYWISDNDVPAVSNIGIVVGTRAALVIDTGLGPRNGQTVVREATKVAPNRDLYLSVTHVHPEHDLGAQGFPASTKVIRSRDQDKDIAEFGLDLANNFAKTSPMQAELLKGVTYRKTDISFDREYLLDLGGVQVRMLAVGPTHTRGDTVFFIEGDGVLFAGDVVMPAFPAFTSPYSSVGTWVATLGRLDPMKPKIVVPSHGRRGDAPMISAYREYFQAVQTRVRELRKERKSADEAARIVQDEMPKRFPALAYRGANRVELVARTAYREMEQK